MFILWATFLTWWPYISSSKRYKSTCWEVKEYWRFFTLNMPACLCFLIPRIILLFYTMDFIYYLLIRASSVHLLAIRFVSLNPDDHAVVPAGIKLAIEQLSCPEQAHIVVPWGVEFSSDQQSGIDNQYLNMLFLTNAEVPPGVWVRPLTASTKITQHHRGDLTLVMHLGDLVPHNSSKVLKRYYGALGQLFRQNSGTAVQRIDSYNFPLVFRNWHTTRLEKRSLVE